MFYLTVAAAVVAVVLALRRAGVSATVVWLLAVAYLGVPAFLAGAGMLNRPAPALLLVPGIAELALTLACTGIGGRLAASVPMAAIVALQALRIAVEVWLHDLYVEGVVPVQMT